MNGTLYSFLTCYFYAQLCLKSMFLSVDLCHSFEVLCIPLCGYITLYFPHFLVNRDVCYFQPRLLQTLMIQPFLEIHPHFSSTWVFGDICALWNCYFKSTLSKTEPFSNMGISVFTSSVRSAPVFVFLSGGRTWKLTVFIICCSRGWCLSIYLWIIRISCWMNCLPWVANVFHTLACLSLFLRVCFHEPLLIKLLYWLYIILL